jgi:hypothetical protein
LDKAKAYGQPAISPGGVCRSSTEAGNSLSLGRRRSSVIRGSDGGRRMYGAGDALPTVYTERFRTQIYSERVVYPGV